MKGSAAIVSMILAKGAKGLVGNVDRFVKA